MREDARSEIQIEKFRLDETVQDFSDLLLRVKVAASQKDVGERGELTRRIATANALSRVVLRTENIFQRRRRIDAPHGESLETEKSLASEKRR